MPTVDFRFSSDFGNDQSLRNQWQIEIETGSDSYKQGARVFPAPPIIQNINLINGLAGGNGVAITGPGEVRGFSDTTRQGYDYELREWRGTFVMPCSGNMGSSNWCGDYVVVSPRARMLSVIRIKIDAALSGIQPDWSKRD